MTQNHRPPTVLATGVFDILHQEHRNFLRKAKALGYLVVGLESDTRVKEMKGPSRPINSQAVRKKNLEDLGIADEVFILPEEFKTADDHRRLLKKLRPDILAVSSHSNHQPEKASLMQEIGGRLQVVHQHNPAISTTKILEGTVEQ